MSNLAPNLIPDRLDGKFRQIGHNVSIYDPVAVINPRVITLKSHIILSEFVYLAGGQGTYLGNFIHLAAHTAYSGGGTLVINDFVGVAAGTRIITGTDNVMADGIPSPLVPEEFRNYTRSHVILEKHAFLATNVVVMPGVTIGEGAVIGAGSIVTKDVEPWGVYIGAGKEFRRLKARDKDMVLRKEEELMRKYPYEPADYSDIIAQCLSTKK